RHGGGDDEAQAHALDQQCARLAQEYALTEREGEVFRLLARGRNVPFIEEELIISRNTIKTHIKHIYQKMDLHSQQELIDLAETY
uniref:response regulator transcription factor n=1 Tax=Eggerthella sinensis TaxID=242230 RepID=UPI0022E2AEC3